MAGYVLDKDIFGNLAEDALLMERRYLSGVGGVDLIVCGFV